MNFVQAVQIEKPEGPEMPPRVFAATAPEGFESILDGVRPHSEARRVHEEMASRNTVGRMLPDPNAE